MGRLIETDNRYPMRKSHSDRWNPDNALMVADHVLRKKPRPYKNAEVAKRVPPSVQTILYQQVERLNEINKGYFLTEPNIVYTHKALRRRRRR